MSHRVVRCVGRAVLIGAVPLAVALQSSGIAAASSSSQGVPLEVATNPDALDHDPVHNGIVGGAIVGATGSGVLGAALGSGVGAIPGALLGAVVGGVTGGLQGYYNPRSVPQALP
ncbi:hypothetical protein KO481_29865 [Nocardia sp. NEAU-G5]|uniref:Glycine zipper domain-containing protein n=1 Tax=Nocardia albiluteola TaxID=2842303 RepID=A0ABS6B5W1_9NOCA|nr:hypothetical protein [Nocardia albiluteola]MBU3065721.1 hypothetical protein [Nocardia albiluteola]